MIARLNYILEYKIGWIAKNLILFFFWDTILESRKAKYQGLDFTD